MGFAPLFFLSFLHVHSTIILHHSPPVRSGWALQRGWKRGNGKRETGRLFACLLLSRYLLGNGTLLDLAYGLREGASIVSMVGGGGKERKSGKAEGWMNVCMSV